MTKPDTNSSRPRSYWILVHNKTDNPRKGAYSGGTTLFFTKSRALVETMDFPQYHVERVTLRRPK